ncbi:hypothetical protein R6Q59_014884 [Mikania micrantha]
MATTGDGVYTYQSGGAGGKLRKRPNRRSAPATPYDRPFTALRNNNTSLFAKLVDPASRLIYAGADKLFGVFRKRLPAIQAPCHSGTSEEPRNESQEAVPNPVSKNSPIVVEPSTTEGGNVASILGTTDISDLENMLKQKTFTRSEIERLTALLVSKTTESNVVEGDKEKLPSTSYHVLRPDAFTSGILNKHVEERETGNFDAAISTPVVNSRAFEDDGIGTSPAELAKAYMGTRPTKLSPLSIRPSSQAHRQDLMLLNNTTTFPKTPTTSHALKTAASMKTSDNSLTALRSRGRSALYNMPRTPYYRGPSTLSQKGVASPSAWEHEGSIGSSRMAAKRRSSALDDIGSGGPMRRIRQKASLLSQQSSLSKHTSEVGSSQKLLLRNESESKGKKAVEETGEISRFNQNYGSVPTESSQTALKIFEQLERMSPKEKLTESKLAGATEKIDSPKFLSSSQDNQKNEGQLHVLFPDALESTFQNKGTVKENGSRNFAGHSNVLSSVNGSVTVPVSGSAPIITKAACTTKRAFQMRAHEDSLKLDEDNHSNGHVSFSLGVNKKPGTSVLANNDVSTAAHAEIIQTPAPPKVCQTALPEVDRIPAIPESKKGAISPDGSVFNNQMSCNFPASTSLSSLTSQPTSVVDAVTPQNKSTVFPTFGTSSPKSVGPSGEKPIISPARPPGPASLINSTMNNDQVQFSASNKDGNTQKPVNLFGNSGSSSSLTAASASGILSFGSSAKNSCSINGTSASSPSIFAASSSFQPSGISTNKSSSSSPVLLSATTAFLPSTTTTAMTSTTVSTTTSTTTSAFPTSVQGSIFSFGSASVSSTSASLAPTSPFASTSFAASSNGGSIFGLSSPSATLTTNGFQANTQATSTVATQVAPFKFGSGTSVIPSTTSASSLLSSSAPSFGLTSMVTTAEIKSGGSTSGSTTNIFGSGFNSTPSFGLGSTVASSETKSVSSTANMFSSGFSYTPNFGPSSTAASSETISGSSTSNMFSSTPFSFGASSTSTPSAASSPFMFGSSNAGASTGSSMFSFSSNSSSPAPVFGISPTNNNDHMSSEDSMVDDANQTPSPSVPAFAQASTPGFIFGSATTPTPVTQPSMAPFQFGGQTNQSQQQPPQNTFQPPGGSQFNTGGSFSLGSGGDKSNRRIVKVKRQNRKK